MTCKIVITGSSGLLGRSVYNIFRQDQNLTTHGFVFRRNSDPEKIVCDLTDAISINNSLNLLKPDIIIHCAAERRPDVVSSNPTGSLQLNVGGTQELTRWAKENEARVIYISTDYVFDGENSPYKEDDKPNPLNEYGKMKLAGEQIVIDASKNNIVLRVPILYGDVEYIEESAVTILFKKVKDISQPAYMSNYEKRFPTHCDDVAQTIFDIVKYIFKENQNLGGIFHYQSEEEMTKLSMSLQMADVFSLPAKHVLAEDPPTDEESIKRPFKSKMSCEKLKAIGLYRKPRLFVIGIESSLKKFLD